MGESLFQFYLQVFKLVHDGYDGSPMSIISICVSSISILYNYVTYNLFQLYQNKDIPAKKSLKFAIIHSLQYMILILSILVFICSCSSRIFIFKYSNMLKSYNTSESSSKAITNTSLIQMNITDGYKPTDIHEQIVNSTNMSESSISNVLDLTLETKDFLKFLVVSLGLYIINVACLMIIVCLQADNERTYQNPEPKWNILYYSRYQENLTTEILLSLCLNCAVVLLLISSAMVLFSFTFLNHVININNKYKRYGDCEDFFSSDSCEQFIDKIERYRIFFFFCSRLGIIGIVVGFFQSCPCVREWIVQNAYVVEDENELEIKIERNVEVSSNNRFFKRICLSLGISRFVSLIVKCIPLCVRKFVIRHAFNVENENETDMENIERTEQDMVENTVEGIIRIEVFLWPYSIYETEMENEHERYEIFYIFSSIPSAIGCVAGILQSIPCVRKFIVRHANIVEDQNETEMENFERNEHDMGENTVEVASNSESLIETRMAIEGHNGNGIVVVDIHADQESIGHVDGTTDTPQQADRDESEDHESDDIDPEQVKLLVE